MGNKLAIFDLDGTLFDTVAVNSDAYGYAIKECGFQADFDRSYYEEYCSGKSYREFLPEMVQGIAEEDMERIH